MKKRTQLLTSLVCNSKITLSLILVLMVWAPFSLVAQDPGVRGSFPRDGSQDLLRNLFVSVGLNLPNKIGIDLTSLNDTTVKLYPTMYPDSLVPAFVTADPGVKNITLEPLGVLEPNTNYTFEITNGLKNEEGAEFKPYKITFTTGEKALKKHITVNKPRLQKQKEELAEQETQVFQRDSTVGQDIDRLIEVATGELATISEPVKMAAPVIASAKDSALLAAAIAKDSIVNADSVVKSSSEIAKPKEEPQANSSSKIYFPTKIVAANGKLPIRFKLEKQQKVRILIRSSAGTVVKRSIGSIKGGLQQISVSLEDILPGTYTVFLIAGAERVKQKILIK